MLDPTVEMGAFAGPMTAAVPGTELPIANLDLPAANVWELDPVSRALYRKGEVLVKLHSGVSVETRAGTMAAVGLEDTAIQLPGGWEQMTVRGGLSAREALAALRRDTSVAEASLNFRTRSFQARPNDEFYNLQWNFDAIDLPRAWEINPGAESNIIVAVIDSGLNTASGTITLTNAVGTFGLRFTAVPDLVADGRIVAPRDFVFANNVPLDWDGHGSHVAGTIAQQTNNLIGVSGIAYNVRLMPLKALAGDWEDLFFPTNIGGSSALIADAVRYAADNGAHIINMSLGGEGEAPVIADAIEYAVGKGVFVAISAGNEADEGNPVNYPAAYGPEISGAMTVGATNRTSRRAAYSSYGSYVEVCAPGGEGFAFDGGITQMSYDPSQSLLFESIGTKALLFLAGFRPRFDRFALVPLQGTSMAAPHVAGLAALLHSQGITSPAAIEEAIKRFARPIDATADECGAGLIDPRRTLRGLGLAG